MRGAHQPRACAVNLSDAVTERSGSEARHVSVSDGDSNALKLLELRTGNQQVVLNPNVKSLVFVVRLRNRGHRILNEHDLGPALLVARILRDLLLEKLAEPLRVLELCKHERLGRTSLAVHRD